MRVFHSKKTIRNGAALLMAAMLFTGSNMQTAAMSAGWEKATSVNEEKLTGVKLLHESKSCSFIVPQGFNPTETPGFYTNVNYPLESANVTYSVSKIPQDRVLTNAQKAAGESISPDGIEHRYNELKADMYEEILKENYLQLYGENMSFELIDFENITLNGFPGYSVKSTVTPENSQTIHQTTYILLSSNKVYTIVYSRAEDDDFEAVFEESIKTIHIQ